MNSSKNTSDFDSMLSLYLPEEVEIYNLVNKFGSFFYANIFSFFLGIGSFWNLLVIIYFMKINSKNLRKMSSYHFLVINLAFVDLCVTVGGSLLFPFSMKPSWELGAFNCALLITFFTKNLTVVSCWLLVIISFARFRSIVYPLRARINKKKYGLACLTIWITTCLPVKYFLKSYRQKKKDCTLILNRL